MAERKQSDGVRSPGARSRPGQATPAVGSGTLPVGSGTLPTGSGGLVSPARRAAFTILEELASTSAHSDDLLHGRALNGLSQLDRNLVTALVLGVLRWQIALEQQLLALLQRPDQPLPGAVQTALLLGAFQLLHMDRIPAHAALNESVELVRSAGQPQAAGLVNAVLRKLSVAPRAKLPICESLSAASSRLGHPAWLVERWAKRYGREAALQVCAYDQSEPKSAGLFRAGSALDSVERSDAVESAESAQATVESSGNAPPMDDGSRLVAELAAASQPDAGRIWDCCAAPGGKTILLAERHPGAQVIASDRSPRRLRALAARLGEAFPAREIHTVVADVTELSAKSGEISGQSSVQHSGLITGSFDLILCDVPCSGTGTLARNPEIRHRLRPADLLGQAERQKLLLRAALGRLAPGGRLLYSTCSLEPEENESVVEEALRGASHSADVSLLPLGEQIEQLRAHGVLRQPVELKSLLAGPYLRTLPGVGFQGDGFFAALLGRA